ncbi:TetR/AcrR family transcriptional regulator [Jiangella alkaliphila]|uniref:DNA-binding transcriptional regulator, AcrR family n=1 Tax=Jiangella alkaliphila TaxID=419479 RepID=A0A1H2GAB6_9ACTN|nr:TetR family transcriptional regulator [Jiangella alkaliphila]SDU16421.1 DNA-binding transcriptional regulator, AcrR family [Jiangella alkaliphila]
MPWDTEATRRRLLDAAVEEFAEHGPAGARVDRVAKSAGVNKERIYQYFGDKGGLFRTVLTQELQRLAAAVPLTHEQAGDLGDYAGRLFDHHTDHPHFLRLLHWEGLASGGATVAEAKRAALQHDKVAAITDAQRRGLVTDAVGAGQLLYGVMALVDWWFVAPHVVRMTVGADGMDRATQRAAVVELARRMTAPDRSEPPTGASSR